MGGVSAFIFPAMYTSVLQSTPGIGYSCTRRTSAGTSVLVRVHSEICMRSGLDGGDDMYEPDAWRHSEALDDWDA